MLLSNSGYAVAISGRTVKNDRQTKSIYNRPQSCWKGCLSSMRSEGRSRRISTRRLYSAGPLQSTGVTSEIALRITRTRRTDGVSLRECLVTTTRQLSISAIPNYSLFGKLGSGVTLLLYKKCDSRSNSTMRLSDSLSTGGRRLTNGRRIWSVRASSRLRVDPTTLH